MKEVFINLKLDSWNNDYCCSHTGLSKFFLQLPINIIFPLPVVYAWDNADGLVCMYEFMHAFMSVYMYTLYSVYVCMCGCMYVCVWRMTLSMSNGKKIVDLLWGEYLIFTGRQARFLLSLQILPRQLPRLPHNVTTALPVNLISVTKDFRVSLVLPRHGKKRQSDN